ncbi:AzlC family ABC transporter permease [uncultured Parolsenella sp.]|uniref:AzlC family ABC transporter permease n=1 Tax=uncultured Parolsenella sp. TaxID=2083008 RepID=UPI0027DBB616|nr:AzlC family ABC transporter permease [uncultured Parolsenella sp.]
MKKVLAVAWPIMLSYIPLGLACGVLASKCGINPLMGFLMSVTLITGSGQFMISNLWLAGLPAFSIVASVAAVSLRFALYSASLSPYLKKASKRMSLALSYMLIEEAYGVTLSKLSEGEKSWTLRNALALNIVTILTWAVSVSAGSAIGAVLDIPTALAGFVMTALFVCLASSQLTSRGNVVAAVAAAVSVVVLKLVGLANVAVPFAAVIGVAAAFVAAGDAPAEAEVATRGDAA